jgi:TetR/AcrR family transcriptional regulator, transcriptional repressor for nem operon
MPERPATSLGTPALCRRTPQRAERAVLAHLNTRNVLSLLTSAAGTCCPRSPQHAERGHLCWRDPEGERRRAGQPLSPFQRKPELAAVATRSLAADLQAETDVLLADETVPPIDLRAYLDKERDALGGCRLGRLAFDPGRDTGTTAPVAAYFTALQSSLAMLIDQAVADGDLTGTVDAVGLAAAIVACVQGGYILAAATGDAGAMSLALRGLRRQLDAVSSRSPRQDASLAEAPARARMPARPKPPARASTPATPQPPARADPPALASPLARAAEFQLAQSSSRAVKLRRK